MKIRTSIIVQLVAYLIGFVSWVEGMPFIGTICFVAPLILDICITKYKGK